MVYGIDVTLIAMGSMLGTAILASKRLHEDGIVVRVLSMHTVKPIDSNAILRAAKETNVIITVEEHSIIGGLGSTVAEVLADNNVHCKLKRMGIPDEFCDRAYSWEQLRKMYHLTVEDIVGEVVKLKNGKQS
jgi:transketolase